jgi:acylphosphatase
MKLKIKIAGPRVHGVGYRPWLTDAAIDAGLQGFYAINRTENKTPVVIVLVEGDEDSILHIDGIVRADKPQYAQVDRIDAEDYTGEVMSLDRYAMINTSSQMNKAIPLLLGMNNKMDQMLGKQDQTVGKLNKMLEKQDETIGEIRDLREDLVTHSNNDRLARMEKDIRAIKSKIGIR